MPLKILFLSHRFHPDIGGIETISELLAYSFYADGHQVHVLTWSKDKTEKKFPFDVIRNPNLFKLFQEHAWADLVFENNPCLRLSWPGLLYHRPSIIVLQTWLAEVNNRLGFSDRAKLWWLKKANRVVAISDAVRKVCFPGATVIGNSYNVNDFKIIPGIQRNNDFVFFGRLVSDKGGELAIKAFHLLSQQLKEKDPTKKYSLTMIGDGPERGNLEQLVVDLQLEESVWFTGSLRGHNLAICLNQHKYLLVPSIWEEPFGIVALEGMACGCLPIVSDGGGLPGAVGNAGLTFKRGDVNALVNCMLSVLNNPKREEELREEAPGHLAVYHPNEISRKYLNVIQASLNKPVKFTERFQS